MSTAIYDENEIMNMIKNYQCDIPKVDDKTLAETIINIVLNEGITLSGACKLFNITSLHGRNIVKKYISGFDEETQNRVHTQLLENKKRINSGKDQEKKILERLTKLVREERETLTKAFCRNKILQVITPLEIVELLFYYYVDTYKIHLLSISMNDGCIFIRYKKGSHNNIAKIDSTVSRSALIKLFGNYNIGEQFITSLNYSLKRSISITTSSNVKLPSKLTYNDRVKLSFMIYYSYAFLKRFNGSWDYYIKPCDEVEIVLAQKDKVIDNLICKMKPEYLNSYPFIVEE